MPDETFIAPKSRLIKNYELVNDKEKGLEAAIKNGQTRLALEYLMYVISDLSEKINELQEKVDIAEAKKPAAKPKAQATKKDD